MQPNFSTSDFSYELPEARDGAELTVVTVKRQSMTVLSVEGEIDLLTAPQLAGAVATALVDESRCLIIDLTNTTFLSSAGMQVLIDAQTDMPSGGYVGVVADGSSTSRPMKLMGLDQILALSPTLDAAITTFAHADRDDAESLIA